MIKIQNRTFNDLVQNVCESFQISKENIKSISINKAEISQDKHVKMLDKDDTLDVVLK